MKIIVALLILVQFTIANTKFNGPLNLKNIQTTTFNVEDQSKLVVGTEKGELFISEFRKDEQILNYRPFEQKHNKPIVGIKRMEGSGQYITVDAAGKICKWGNNFKRLAAEKDYKLSSNNVVTNVAFVYNKGNQRENRRFAFSTQNNRIHILSTRDLSDLKSFTADQLQIQSIQKISFLNGVLVVYGQDQQNAVVAIYPNNTHQPLFENKDGYLKFVSQFNSRKDFPQTNGIALTGNKNLYYIDLDQKQLNSSGFAYKIAPISQTEEITSLNYCGRTIYDSKLAKKRESDWEDVAIVGFGKYFVFYTYAQDPQNQANFVVKKERYDVAGEAGITQIQCFYNYVFVLTKNGVNDQLITIPLQYQYEEPIRSEFTSFLIMALMVAVVGYQIKKYMYKKRQAAQADMINSKYVQLQEIATIMQRKSNL